MDGSEVREFGRVLIVDDDPVLLGVLTRLVGAWASVVVPATSCREGLALLADGPDVVITDLSLGDGSGLDIAIEANGMHRAPRVIAISGAVSSEQAFELGRNGVSAMLLKPFRPDALQLVLRNLAAPRPSELDEIVRRSVGAEPMPELLHAVRRSMVAEALTRTGDNKAQAAALLGISRQHLQKILERGQA